MAEAAEAAAVEVAAMREKAGATEEVAPPAAAVLGAAMAARLTAENHKTSQFLR